MKSLILIFLIGVSFVALGQADIEDAKQQHLKDLAELKFKMDKLYQELLNESNAKEVKNVKLFLRYLTVYYTRIEYNYEKSFTIYDLKIKILKQYCETFLKERKLSSSIDLESKFRVTKHDEYEYEINVQQVLLKRIIIFTDDEIEKLNKQIDAERDYEKRYELIGKLIKLKDRKKETEYLSDLEDIVLIELREFSEMNGGTIDYIRRKSSKFIRSFENMTNVDEINYFDDFEKDRFDDEKNMTIALLHELSVLSSGETRFMTNMEKEGRLGKKWVFEEHINEMRAKISDIAKEVKLVVDWYKQPVNDASKLYN